MLTSTQNFVCKLLDRSHGAVWTTTAPPSGPLTLISTGQDNYKVDANSKGRSHRLFREIIISDSIPNDKDEECLSLPTIQWETLASNLEDFSKVAEKFAISKSTVEVADSMKLQDDAIPTLEKLRKGILPLIYAEEKKSNKAKTKAGYAV
ncbi:hypothetical protein JHK82_018834 [Glycine max]|nr:hypothetical protein JHK85_019280 [Glycine max]KAG5038018.1 hypothetical protein JHK86_018858 [Glycine max]KAG5143139.1 hypothetical protein JHK82_018834 [Glycine max]